MAALPDFDLPLPLPDIVIDLWLGWVSLVVVDEGARRRLEGGCREVGARANGERGVFIRTRRA